MCLVNNKKESKVHRLASRHRAATFLSQLCYTDVSKDMLSMQDRTYTYTGPLNRLSDL